LGKRGAGDDYLVCRTGLDVIFSVIFKRRERMV